MKIKLNLKEMELLRQSLIFYASHFSRNITDAMALYFKLIEKSVQFEHIKNKEQ